MQKRPQVLVSNLSHRCASVEDMGRSGTGVGLRESYIGITTQPTGVCLTVDVYNLLFLSCTLRIVQSTTFNPEMLG